MVSYLCKVAGVSKSGYYNYFSEKSQKQRELKDEKDDVVWVHFTLKENR